MIRVLIVDDKEDNLYDLQSLLGAHGYEVETARHGAEALIKARTQPPQLIVADLLMPIMDGYTLLRHWKADERLRSIPFVVYTATYTTAEDERLAFDLGADAFILKPCGPDEFVQRLGQVHLADQSTESAAIGPINPSSDDETNVFKLYSRTLIRKLEEKSIQLETINQALKKDIAEREQIEAEHAALLLTLGERVKELRALFKTGEILRDDCAAVADVLAAVVALLPDAMCHPERASARICWGEHAAQSVAYQPSKCRLHTCFQSSDGVEGEVEIVYRDEDQVPEFLAEEQELISSVSEQLRGFLNRRLSQEALRQSEARFREMAENVGEIFFNFDPVNDRLLYVNRAYEEIWGRPCADAYAHPETYMDSIHPVDRSTVEDATRRLNAGQQTDIEYRIIRPDQQVRWVQEHAVPVLDASGAVERKVGSIRDISARKHADARIRDSEERFRLLAKATNDAIWDWDLQRNALWWGDGMETLFGFRPDDLEPGIESWTKRLHPEERDTVQADVRAAIENGAQSWTGRYRFARSDGTYAHVHDRGHFIRDETGKALRMIGGLTDVSEQHRAEQALEQSLIDLGNRNRELQDFAFIASHDLQEPLRKIRAFADILQQRHAVELSSEAAEYLLRIDQASTRMQTLINDLLAYSRVATKDFHVEEVDLDAVCREVLVDLEDRIESSAAILSIGPLPTITADPIQMRQLLQNLLANAMKFQKPELRPEISVTALPVMIDNVAAVEVTISDNGIGFESRFAEKIFNPFQRLHSRAEYEGSGIGLAIVRRIVERHRGRITTESALGQGATFMVTLPISQAHGLRASTST